MIETNASDELAVVSLSGHDGKNKTRLKGYQEGNSYFKHFVEINDNENKAIKVGKSLVKIIKIKTAALPHTAFGPDMLCQRASVFTYLFYHNKIKKSIQFQRKEMKIWRNIKNT